MVPLSILAANKCCETCGTKETVAKDVFGGAYWYCCKRHDDMSPRATAEDNTNREAVIAELTTAFQSAHHGQGG